ncbi:MAG: tRNA guanosine(34) transglycosylase Tgt [Pseudomonadota bacterium]
MSHSFQVTKTHGAARTGVITTAHGTIQTPAFLFCATKAALKGMTMDMARALGMPAILCNTYHLMIQPGAARIAHLGGLHAVADWQGPILTDSGGYQIFSMGHGSVGDEIKGRAIRRESFIVSIADSGVIFRSYQGGEKLLLTPERAMALQRYLGADLVVQLDECTPFHAGYEATAKAMRRSVRWLDRSLATMAAWQGKSAQGHPQGIYGVIQGGVWDDLRAQSAQAVAARHDDLFGIAIGGSLGSTPQQMREAVDMALVPLPAQAKTRPIHLLGVGEMGAILHGVSRGIDTFDCVHPLRIARHGTALRQGQPALNLGRAIHADDRAPLDEACACPTCQAYTRGYIHHLFKAREMLAGTLVSVHNAATMMGFMADLRTAIDQGVSLESVAKAWIA